MHAYLHRFVRKSFIQEIQALIDLHPYYSRDLTVFQSEPLNIIEKFTFEGRQFPVIMVDRTSFTEQPLGMDKKITDIYGHNRTHTMMSTLLDRVWDYNGYSGAYVDGSHLLEYVNVNLLNDERIFLRIDSRYSEKYTIEPSTSPTTVATTYKIDNGSLTVYPASWTFTPNAVPADGEYTYTPETTTVTFGPVVDKKDVVVNYNVEQRYREITEDSRYRDIIPGAELLFGAFNNIRPGDTLYIDSYKDARALGELFGSRFRGTVSFKIYAQTQIQAEEIVDLLQNYFIYALPHRMYYTKGINVVKTDSSDVIDKTGELGEEAFSGSLTTNINIEGTFFVPSPILEAYDLWIELRERIDKAGTKILYEVSQ